MLAQSYWKENANIYIAHLPTYLLSIWGPLSIIFKIKIWISKTHNQLCIFVFNIINFQKNHWTYWVTYQQGHKDNQALFSMMMACYMTTKCTVWPEKKRKQYCKFSYSTYYQSTNRRSGSVPKLSRFFDLQKLFFPHKIMYSEQLLFLHFWPFFLYFVK